MTIGLLKWLKSLLCNFRIYGCWWGNSGLSVPQTIFGDPWFLSNKRDTVQQCLLCAAAPQVSTHSNASQQYLTLKPHRKSHGMFFFSPKISSTSAHFNVVVSQHDLGNNIIFVPLQLNQDKICFWKPSANIFLCSTPSNMHTAPWSFMLSAVVSLVVHCLKKL